jgi:uncharacterized protein (DUF58 family)
VLILFLGLVGGVILVINYVNFRQVSRDIEEYIKLGKREISDTIIAGEKHRTVIEYINNSNYIVDFELGKSYRKVKYSIRKLRNFLELNIEPQVSGIYSFKELNLKLNEGLGLITGTIQIPFNVDLRVYPRFFPVVLQIMNYLQGTSSRGLGESPMMTRGRGLDYAESRPYQPGDPLYSFDWKAYARLRIPIVKTFYMEGEEAPSIVGELIASDPVSLDELRKTVLEVVYYYSRNSPSLDLSLSSGRGSYRGAGISSTDALVNSLQMVLEGKVEEFKEYYQLLHPMDSGNFLEKISKWKNHANNKEPMGSASNLLVICSLQGDKIYEYLKHSRTNGSHLTVIQPNKPWIHTETLENAVKIQFHYKKTYRILKEYHVNIFLNTYEYLTNAYRVMQEKHPIYV